MLLKLYIYSGLGNIIAIVDSVREDTDINSESVVNLYQDKKINFDQLIQILPPINPENDFDVLIYNNDGSLASNCINGARCVSKFIEDHSLCASRELKVGTDGGVWFLKAISNEIYSASFEVIGAPEKININSGCEDLNLDCINLGNPHGVAFQEQYPEIDFIEVGIDLQNNSAFPDGVNFGFVNILNESEISLRVYERGAGETLSCGSGACAAAIIGISNQGLIAPVKVNFQEGSLLIDYKKETNMISAEGSADFLEEKQIEI